MPTDNVLFALLTGKVPGMTSLKRKSKVCSDYRCSSIVLGITVSTLYDRRIMLIILVSQEFYLSMDLYQDFNWKTVLIKRPNGLTSNLLITCMLILLQSRSERSKFSWLQRLRWFWSSFSSNFYGIEIPRFHKIRFSNRYLRACIECVGTPGFQVPTGRLFCIMHTLLLSMNWFRSNVGGMLLQIVWNSLIWIWILC
jgi:hypothetical protein